MPTSRPSFLAVSLLLVLVQLIRVDAQAQNSLAGRRPNIVFIITDDQGYGDLGRHGNPVIRTPHLDRLHDESVRFEDFHVSPTCAPTRAALLSGRHEFRVGITHTILERERLSLKATTLPQILKSSGYATGIFGKWHLGDEAAYRPDQRGFDETFIHGAGGIGQSYAGSCGDAPENLYFDPVILHNGVFEKTKGYATDVFFSQALQWIEARKDQGPFYCHIATNAPHLPLQVPPEYEALYAGKVDNAMTAKFLGMVTNIDDNVGRLLARLKDLGLDRETLVVFMNDNGGTLGTKIHNAGMRGQKVTAHNGGTRAISLWRWPGTLQPAAVNALTAHLDFLPTLAELAGASVPEAVTAKLEGHSLVPLLMNPVASWHEDRFLVTHVGRWNPGTPPMKLGAVSVRQREHLLVREGTAWALYDLKADPGETRNLAATRPEVAASLAKIYDTWWDETLPLLDNEDGHRTAPKTNSFRDLYVKQYRGPGPNQVVLRDGELEPAQTASRLNVLFLVTDDQAADAVAALGNSAIKTPNLDRLVERGFVLRQAYCMGSTTPAVCMPSRHMLLSGQSLYRYDPKQRTGTLGDVFRKAGYDTWHLSKRGNEAPEYHRAFERSGYLDEDSERKSGHHGRAAADRTVEYLRGRDRQRPFLAFVGFEGPHDPCVAADEWLRLYKRDELPLPANFLPHHPFDNGELLVRDEKLAPWPRTPEVLRQRMHDHYACISSIDHAIGRIVAALAETGELDRTIIVFTSDHGLAMGSHGLLGKQSLYEPAMRVPLVLAGPRIPRGQSDALSYLFDLLPTVCDLVDIPPPAGSDGKSLRNVIEGHHASVRETLFLAYRDVQRAVRQGDWKLIRYPQVDFTQLFNLREDPHELLNLAAAPAHTDRVQQMLKLLATEQARLGDSVPLTVPSPKPAAVTLDFFQRAGAETKK